MSLKYPIDKALAAKAHRLAKRGIRGKEAAEKLGEGLKAPDANLLASVGGDDEAEAQAGLSENELALLFALAAVERERRRNGETSSPKAWMLCRLSRLSEGQIGRLTRKRLDGVRDTQDRNGGALRLLSHSRNGHIWMLPAGWTLVRTLETAIAKARGEQP